MLLSMPENNKGRNRKQNEKWSSSGFQSLSLKSFAPAETNGFPSNFTSLCKIFVSKNSQFTKFEKIKSKNSGHSSDYDSQTTSSPQKSQILSNTASSSSANQQAKLGQSSNLIKRSNLLNLTALTRSLK